DDSFPRSSWRAAVRMAALPLLAAIASACAGASPDTPSGGSDGAADAAIDLALSCDDLACYVCNSDRDCPNNLKCETSLHLCVPCVHDSDCPGGQVCDPAS